MIRVTKIKVTAIILVAAEDLAWEREGGGRRRRIKRVVVPGIRGDLDAFAVLD